MVAIVTIMDEKTGHIFIKDKLVEPYKEQRDPLACVTRYDFRLEFNVNDLYFRDLLDNVDVKESCPNRCIVCKYFRDEEYYADNTVTACAVSWGSCMKCNRNITSTSPHTEVPSWCPLKGEENGST